MARIPIAHRWVGDGEPTDFNAGIAYFSAPYDLEAVDMLNPHVPCFKIGSGDITWLEILEKVARTGKPVILSTGASDFADVKRAVETILAINPALVLLQCNTNYTGNIENFKHIHLRVLTEYARSFPQVVLGLSDHTPGLAAPLGAVALGARVIEKHFTDDNTRTGPDHAFSMMPGGWRELEDALGSAEKRVAENEADTVIIQRRCLRAARPLTKGTVLRREDIDVLRPAPSDGIFPYELGRVLGRRVKIDVAQGDYLRWAMLDVLADVRRAVLHAGPTQSCGYLAALSEFHPFLLMSWGSDLLVDAERSEVWRRATSVALHGSDLLLCDSAAVRTKAHPLLGYDDSRIVQFPWGVDLKEFRPGADDRGLRHEMGWDDSFIILSTRSWEPLYGIETLLEAFRRAYAKEPRMRLILLGGGSLASKIERFLKSNKLDRFVHRPGVMPHDAISAYFRAVDLYVSCSLSDGSSVSLLEAMATGLPVVVSDTPGNREWVVSGKNGWLAPVGDAEAFAGHLITSSRSGSSARARISQANRGIAERRADWSRNSEQLRQAYERLAGA